MAHKRRSLPSIACLVAFTATAVAQDIGPAPPAGRDWPREMVRVHARFHGRPGTFAQFGDSITETLAFWTPLKQARKNAPARMEHAFRRVEAHLRPECWRDWKGPEFGNQGGRTIRWAEENVGAWLERLDPEVALVMFGTNDLHDYSEKALRSHGYGLRNYLVLMKYAEVIEVLAASRQAAGQARSFSACRNTGRSPQMDVHRSFLRTTVIESLMNLHICGGAAQGL